MLWVQRSIFFEFFGVILGVPYVTWCSSKKSKKITFFTYRFTWGRHGDPGVVESPRGAVLGARWPFLILAQRPRKGKPLLSAAHRMLIMAKKNVMSTKIKLFWVFRSLFGGSIWNLVVLGKIEKSTFFTYGFFQEFIAISPEPERQLFEELKKYFTGAKSRNIRGEGGILDSQRMQLMTQLFLRWDQRYACATLAATTCRLPLVRLTLEVLKLSVLKLFVLKISCV